MIRNTCCSWSNNCSDSSINLPIERRKMSTFGKLKVESIIWCRERDLVNECIVLSIKKVNETY